MKQVIAILMLGWALPLAAHAAKPHTYVLVPGAYEKISIDDGEHWLGVYATAAGCSVKPCVIKVSKEKNPETGTYPDIVTWVRATPGEGLMFMVKGNPKIQPGPLPTGFCDKDDRNPEVGAVTVGKRVYTFSRATEESASGGKMERLYVAEGAQRMLVAETGARDSVILKWAGDLDGDGRLDAYVLLSHHNYNEDQLLFLSGHAGNASTERVARFSGRKLQ